MAYRDEQQLDDSPPMLPEVGSGQGGTTGQDPQTMEQLFNPNRTDPPQGMPRGDKTMVASNKDMPMPSKAPATPDMPERAPTQDLQQGLINPDDTRYKDPQNLLMGNVIMGGMLPWAQAAADVASGRVPKEQFDEVRMEHQRKLEELKDQHPEFVSAAEKAMPFLEGLGMSVMKPASTAVGTMARGAAAAAPQGGARGYSSGPVEEPSASMKRGVSAVGGAATDATIGAAGAAVGVGVGKVTSIVAERGARKAAEAASRKLDDEAKAASTELTKRKVSAFDAAADAKRGKQMDKEFIAKTEAENQGITADHQRYNSMPDQARLSKHWENNRKVFAQDPVHAFNAAAQNGQGIEGMSRALNLPPSVIVNRLAGKKLDTSAPTHQKLFEEMMHVDSTLREFSKRGLKPAEAPNAETPKAEAPKPTNTQQQQQPQPPEAKVPPAEPPATPPAKPKAKRKPAAKPADNPYEQGWPYNNSWTPNANKTTRKKK